MLPRRRASPVSAGSKSTSRPSSLSLSASSTPPTSPTLLRMARITLMTILPWCVLTSLFFTTRLHQKHQNDRLAVQQSRRLSSTTPVATAENDNSRNDSPDDTNNNKQHSRLGGRNSAASVGVVPDSMVFFPDSVPKPTNMVGSLSGQQQDSNTGKDRNSNTVQQTSSSSSSASSSSSSCDLIPIEGGRFMYRNRVRIADKELTHICGPKVLFIGAQKCGTDTVADLLLNHPRIVLNQCSLVNTKGGPLSCHPPWFQRTKQGNYFNVPDLTHHRREDSEGWLNTLARRMPLTDGVNKTTFEKSPTYLETQIFPDVAEEAHKVLPNAKIVATLCNPAERLYSEFHHPGPLPQFYLDNGLNPPKNFGQFVDLLKPTNPICDDKDKVGFCEANRKMYLSKGEYIDNLRPWIETYGHDNVLMLNMDDSPEQTVKRLLHHVGLPEDEYPWETLSTTDVYRNRNLRYEGRSSGYKYFESHMKWLEEYYAPYNDALIDQLKVMDGTDESYNINWPSQWNCHHFPEAPYCKNYGHTANGQSVQVS
mmetsp:Transcript_29962/g.72667  ORF Transcript_29962/g.72667 Transcript_29962/m.72667 type:complete len:537 (-) Transcript_29962:1744-3354(-)